MNAEIRPIKTAAETALAEGYAARRAASGDGPLEALREAAFRRFDAQGLPHRRLEAWRYTDLRAAMRKAQPIAVTAKAGIDVAGGALPEGFAARRILFVDGALIADQSDLDGLEAGLTIVPMAQALAENHSLVAQQFGLRAFDDGRLDESSMASADATQIFHADPAVTLNTALMRDGVLIHLAEGVRAARPIHLVFASGSAPASVFTRSLVIADEGSALTLIESHDGGRDHQVNHVFEIVARERAHVDHVKITGAAEGVIHVASTLATLGNEARFNSFILSTGGALIRNQQFLRYEGAGAWAGLGGATLVSGVEHIDNTVVADHAARGCESREVFKAVLDGRSRSVFQGRIIVRQAAQKTDARMMTQALLLSDEAEADHKPELEIFADDVQCGHGATSGALDEDLRFYLMSRGVPKAEAESLLVQAFVGAAVEQVADEDLRDMVMERVRQWLRSRGERP